MAYGGAYGGAYDGNNDTQSNGWNNSAYGDNYYNGANSYGGNNVYGDNAYNPNQNTFNNVYGQQSQPEPQASATQVQGQTETMQSSTKQAGQKSSDFLTQAHDPSLKYKPPEANADGSHYGKSKIDDCCESWVPPEWLVRGSMITFCLCLMIALIAWYLFNDRWLAIIFFVFTFLSCILCTKWRWKRCCSSS